MKYSEYVTNCLNTWGVGNDDIRIQVGIEEEFGELSGKVKRYYRGDYENNPDKFVEDITGELGDCLYYCCMAIENFCTTSDFELSDIREVSNFSVTHEGLFLKWKQLMALKRHCLDNGLYVALVSALTTFSNELGISINNVIEYNINKLNDRKKRGVIKGTGDNR